VVAYRRYRPEPANSMNVSERNPNRPGIPLLFRPCDIGYRPGKEKFMPHANP